jgi:hypothetical protein
MCFCIVVPRLLSSQTDIATHYRFFMLSIK